MPANSNGGASTRPIAVKFAIQRSPVRPMLLVQGAAGVRGEELPDGVAVQLLYSQVEGGAKLVCRRYKPPPMRPE